MTDGTLSERSFSPGRLYMAIELSATKWLVAFGASGGRAPRKRTVDAGDLDLLLKEIATAKVKLGLDPKAEVVSCYEAGRDGFWLHRALTAQGVTNRILESASIEVNRRHRRAKTDGLDVESLLRVLIRLDAGDEQVCRVVNVPNEADEDARRLHRERDRLKKEVTQLRNGIFGRLATQGVTTDPDRLPAFLATAKTRDGREFGLRLKQELLRMHARLELLNKQLDAVEKEQQLELRRQNDDPKMKQVAMLMCLCGVGLQGAWQLVAEFFGWRGFRNRREVGALAGLTGTPYNSGGSNREQGISKAGNKRIRRLAVELAWLWLRHQPNSALSLWYMQRYGKTATRSRKVGIVALARKLLVALWHFVESGCIPTGARLSPSRGVERGLLDELRRPASATPAMGAAS